MRIGHGLARFVGDQHAVGAAGQCRPCRARRRGTAGSSPPCRACRSGVRTGSRSGRASGHGRRGAGGCRRRGAVRPSRPCARDIFCTTMPACSSSTSMTTSSIGSSRSPALVLLHDDARTRDGELEAFAAHGLDQHRQLQFAAAGDVEAVLVGGFLDLQRDIAFGFAQQAVADDAAGDLVALGAGKRAVVDDEGHGDGRRIDRLGVQRLGDRRVAEGVGDGALRQAGDGDDVARLRFVDRLALEAAEGEDLGDAAGFDQRAVMVAAP